MKINNQLEPPLTAAKRPPMKDADTAARRSLYHPAAVARLGRVLRERYRLESLLGMGAMGEVYRAVDLRLDQPCAVKLVFPGAVFSLQAHRRFVNEARVVSRLFHPNIVEVRDFNEDPDGTKFLVMELLEGQDLHELLSQKGRLPLPRAIEIVRSVGAALQYAHDLGIVHRDVKPNNIFLGTRARRDGRTPRDGGDGDGEQIKVLDFGLAKLLTDHAGQGQLDDESASDYGGGAAPQLTKGIIIGTPAYLSPEATSTDSSGVDARADQWSLAVVAYQLLAGRLPFGNPNPYRLCQMICSEEPVRLRTLVPGLPEHIDAAIHTALAKQREDRFPKMLDFIRSLGNLPTLGRGEKGHPMVAATRHDHPVYQHSGTDDYEPTEVEPYLPGLTRPRLALLATSSPPQRSVPEFVEPDRELCALRVPRQEPDQPNPELLVTAHYTAEQLLELSRITSIAESESLVHAAQDVPTAPYRFGVRSAILTDNEVDQTPLPVPQPLLTERSASRKTVAAPLPPPPCAMPTTSAQFTATLIPTPSKPPRPPSEAFAEPAPIKTVLLGPRAVATLSAFANGDSAKRVSQILSAGGTPSAVPPMELLRSLRVPLDETHPLNSTQLQLQMPPLLTLPGTRPAELGSALFFTPPPRRRWWRTVGAGSVALGLLVALLLGLRLARTKPVSSGAPALTRHALATPVPLPATAQPLEVQVAYALPGPPERGLVQSLLPYLVESSAQLQELPPAPPEASSSAQ